MDCASLRLHRVTSPESSGAGATRPRRASLSDAGSVLVLPPGVPSGAGAPAATSAEHTEAGVDAGGHPGFHLDRGEVDTRGITFGLSIKERRALFERDQTKR